MDLMDYLRGQERIRKGPAEGVKERYTRIVIDLGTAREDEKMHLVGDYLAVAKMDGGASTTFFKLNHRNSRGIYPSEIEKLYATFNGIWLTNAAEAGKQLVLYIGGALSGEIKTATGKTGLKDSSGSDINPVEDKHFIAHTGGHIKVTLATLNTALEISQTSIKVRSAVISSRAYAFLWGFTSTVKQSTEIGAYVAAGGSVSVEFCDLQDIFFVDYDGSNKPTLQVEYIKEA